MQEILWWIWYLYADEPHISPLGWAHILITGEYRWLTQKFP